MLLGPLAATTRAVQLHRALGIASTRRRIPRQQPPTLIERDYARDLLGFVAVARRVLEPLSTELPQLLQSAARDRARTDAALAPLAPPSSCHWCRGTGLVDNAAALRLDIAPGPCGCIFAPRLDAGESKRVRDLMAAAAERLRNAVPPRNVEDLARSVASSTSTYQRQQLGRQVKAALGVDLLGTDRALQTHVEGFVTENVALIKDVPLRIVRDIELLVSRAVASGTRWEDIAADLEKRFGYGADRAKLIARDQVGKLYGQLNAQRQRALGVTRFTWRTVHDERVRDEHQALDGQVFEYANPPAEGLPGEPIQCRCTAEPIFTDILDALDPEGA